MPDTLSMPFDNSFAHEMSGFYVPWKGDTLPAPSILRLNRVLAGELGLDAAALDSAEGAAALSGAQPPAGATPLAMVYAGHQFGGFSPQLGDGRALLLGEIIGRDGQRRDLHLKGSGRTPFSRSGDGKAVLKPVLREYLMGEAMHALGIPTTRALAAVKTGEKIVRDGLEDGAVLARIAASHLRVGTFQFFAARGETDKVRKLADYTLARHFPDITNQDDRYLELFRRVRDRQAALVAKWVNVGFVHGVMNTDNTTISGETIDYGPCAFIDTYDPKAVFSSIDWHGRYAYGKQSLIMQWNLSRFAETLIDVVNPEDSDDAIRQLTNETNVFSAHYQQEWLKGMRGKLGLVKELPEDFDLANGLLKAAEGQNVDFTQLFRTLSTLVRGDAAPARALFDTPTVFDAWVAQYQRRIAQEALSAERRAAEMDSVNPIYIPRNHLVEAALQAAANGDMNPFDRLSKVLAQPYTEQPDADAYAEPAPQDFGCYTTFCGT